MNAIPNSPTGRAGTQVELVDVRRRYGAVCALDGLNLTLNPGELVALLGPSGCGKTTALRILAGLEDTDGGHVLIGGTNVTGLPVNKRDIGMVFQAYSLFPHLTARQNVAFGLRRRVGSKSARLTRASDMLDLVGLTVQADRYPKQMSGGQQQRVALARALAIQPTVLLLDEPLAALDARVRVQLRDEIRRIQLDVGTTTLFVTHDQEEALAIADRVGVMSAGRLEQLDAPADIYSRPKTPFVAEFVGASNRLPARITRGWAESVGVRFPLLNPSVSDGDGTIIVRPEAIGIEEDCDAPHSLSATVVVVAFLGASSRLTLLLDSGITIHALLPTASTTQYPVGRRVNAVIRPDPVLAVTDP